MRVGFNPKNGKVKTDAGIATDAAFLAHFQIPADNAIAASDTYFFSPVNLTTAAQDVVEAFTGPTTPRCLRIKGNLAGVVGNVKITGTNFAGETITETIALNGANAVEGTKAFRSISKVELPVESHASAAQVETATVAGTVSTAGNASVVVTCTGMTGSPKTIPVAVALNDDASAIAGKIRAVLAADAAVTALFDVSGATDKVILTRKTRAANIANLNMAISDGTSVGVTTAASSADTTAGVAYDTVSLGVNEKLGLPYKLTHNTVLKTYLDNALEANAPTVTVSSTGLESNTIDLDSALASKVVDVYLIV